MSSEANSIAQKFLKPALESDGWKVIQVFDEATDYSNLVWQIANIPVRKAKNRIFKRHDIFVVFTSEMAKKSKNSPIMAFRTLPIELFDGSQIIAETDYQEDNIYRFIRRLKNFVYPKTMMAPKSWVDPRKIRQAKKDLGKLQQYEFVEFLYEIFDVKHEVFANPKFDEYWETKQKLLLAHVSSDLNSSDDEWEIFEGEDVELIAIPDPEKGLEWDVDFYQSGQCDTCKTGYCSRAKIVICPVCGTKGTAT